METNVTQLSYPSLSNQKFHRNGSTRQAYVDQQAELRNSGPKSFCFRNEYEKEMRENYSIEKSPFVPCNKIVKLYLYYHAFTVTTKDAR